MLNQISTLPLVADIQVVGATFQMATAVIAAIIGMITFRYTKRQSALALINENNSLANLVNATILQSEQARETLGRLHNFVVGCADDAILFMYLNYVHNTLTMCTTLSGCTRSERSPARSGRTRCRAAP
jgi:hypothetical protein